jgi:hypothetical protein
MGRFMEERDFKMVINFCLGIITSITKPSDRHCERSEAIYIMNN